MMKAVCDYIISTMKTTTAKTPIAPIPKHVDDSIAIMEYVEESCKELSDTFIKSSEVYASFLKWATQKKYLHTVSHTTFVDGLKQFFDVEYKLEEFPVGMCPALVFPNLMHCV
jgi:hypothetical protein